VRIALLCIACLPLLAAADGDERARIAAERQALLQRFAQEEADCQRHFAVTDCVLGVRDRRRAALAPLRARELLLDEADRQRRAADRKAAIEARQKAQAVRPPPPQAPDLPPRDPAPPATPEAGASSPSPSPPASASASAAAAAARPTATPAAPGRSASDAEARAAAAAERVRAAQRRREAFEANEERIRRRLAEREAAGRAADPLPVPGSSPGR
jgi:colicin import membrane protein